MKWLSAFAFTAGAYLSARHFDLWAFLMLALALGIARIVYLIERKSSGSRRDDE